MKTNSIILKTAIIFVIALGILLHTALLPKEANAQKKPKISVKEQYNMLKKQQEELQEVYWNDKERYLKDKNRLNEELKTIDEALKSDYKRKNNFTEEFYLVKENLSTLKEREETIKNETTTFFSQVQELINKEKKKVSGLFPYYIDQALVSLSAIEDKFSSTKKIQGAILSIFNYKIALLQESEKVVVSGKEIKFNNNKNAVTGYSLRVGFIHESLNAPDTQGLVLRETGLQGMRHKWKDNMSTSLKNDIKRAVRQSVDNLSKDIYVQIPLDAALAGSKLKSFASDNQTANIFKQMVDFFKAGGLIMYPLACLALFAFIIAVERILFFIKINRINKGLLEQLEKYINNKNIESSKRLCETHKESFLAKIILPVLSNPVGKNFETVANQLEESLISHQPTLEKRLTTLAVLGAIAPLLGLLGTVSGMISLFDVITVYGTSNPKILAGGISIALVTTQTGLAIAIPTILVHHVLIRIKTSIINKVESLSLKTINLICS